MGKAKASQEYTTRRFKEKHQFLGYFNQFFLTNIGFKLSVAKLGVKGKLENGKLKEEYIFYKGKGTSTDKCPLIAWDMFKQTHVYKEEKEKMKKISRMMKKTFLTKKT
eukprot:7495230-Ditylum_brightwellii.AAC.1